MLESVRVVHRLGVVKVGEASLWVEDEVELMPDHLLEPLVFECGNLCVERERRVDRHFDIHLPDRVVARLNKRAIALSCRG